jgi:glutamate N-acetyltransferase/amino-acid N-acetyltransferase
MKNCELLAEETAKVLNIPADSVIIGSTGVIGAQLPMEKMVNGIGLLAKQLGEKPQDATLAAEAIMTTDTVSKQIAYELEIGGKTVHIGGMCKGSGMIHPNMCTMLAFVTTDVNISKEMLTEIVKENVKDTFNMISVDGDTSTNDTMIVAANGLAENPKITGHGGDYDKFSAALKEINTYLAKKMAGDGEGATALFEVTVRGADTKENAVILAKSVVTSSLVKCAICGHDANWGRILCALGYSGVDFDPEKVDIFFESRAGKLKIVENSVATGYSEEEATKILSEDEVTAIIDMKMGDATATAWGCDLTHEYVSINADYRS